MFMLCNEIQAEELKDKDWNNWSAETKFDGMRMMLTKKGDQIRGVGRRELFDISKIPEAEELKSQPHDFVIDTELCVFNDKGVSDFELQLSRSKTKDKFKIKLLAKKYPATFVAFDILELDGVNLRQLPLVERRKKFMELTPAKCLIISNVYDDPISAFELAKKNSWEGIIIKRNSSPYIEDRSPDWLKVKRKEYVIVRWTGYEVNNKGITLFNKDGLRCACLGEQSREVKATIDSKGFADCEIQRLGGLLISGLNRQPTFVRLIKEVDENGI